MEDEETQSSRGDVSEIGCPTESSAEKRKEIGNRGILILAETVYIMGARAQERQSSPAHDDVLAYFSADSLLLHHELHELVVCSRLVESCGGAISEPWQKRTIDAAVAILVSLADHLVDLVVRELLADRCHNVAELSRRDEAVVVAVEHLKMR